MTLQRWNGSAWVDAVPQRWNGSAWVPATTAKRWNGSAWVDLVAGGGGPDPTAFELLADDFTGSTVNASRWPDAYGGVTLVGGRARVPAVPAYAGLQSAAAWKLEGSHVFVEVPAVPAATGTATTATVHVLTAVEGTSLGFTYNAIAGTLRLFSNIDYWDDTAVTLTYSGTTHRWWRLREQGGTVYWDTSQDGVTWTNRRSLATPAWVKGAKTLRLETPAYSTNSASTSYAEFAHLNVAP
ncbi:hypothetical protein ACWEQ7_21985 [Streptomyces sp. NPDC004069]